MNLGENHGIQRVIYFCYRDKELAKKWLNNNKHFYPGIKISVVDFADVKKGNPTEFLLNVNISM